MLVAVVVTVCVLATFSVIFAGVHVLRPRSFRLHATVTKWLSLRLEIDGTDPPD